MSNKIVVEVAYALENEQTLLSLEVDEGATAQDAIIQSGLLEKYPDIDLEKQKIGIFSHLVPLDTPLKKNDRVEIYRPLLIDPKEIRRLRAKKQKSKE